MRISYKLRLPFLIDHTLAKNVVWNFLGQSVPLAAAVLAAPALITGLGPDRFGVLTLGWAVMGYFSLFDLGFGRALTKVLAEQLGTAQEEDIPALVWTGLVAMLMLGVAGTWLLSLVSPWLVYRVLKIPDQLQSETLSSFYVLALTIPIIVTNSGLRGVLEAYQRFDLVNAVRIPLGTLQFLAPSMTVAFSSNLVVAMGTLLFLRFAGWLAYFVFCLKLVPKQRFSRVFKSSAIRPLAKFGLWMTISNVISPLMVTLDRFLIASLLSVSAVAYYATPYEVVTRLWIIPSALVAVLFPAFSASFIQDRSRTALLFGRGVHYVFLTLFPITLVLVSFPHQGLALWLGDAFAYRSAGVLQWLAAGVFVNSLAQVAFVLVQGIGRPDLTAKLHLLELPVYLLTAWWLIGIRGIEGAAMAWSARVSLDAALLFGAVWRIFPTVRGIMLRMSHIICSALFLLLFIVSPFETPTKAIALCSYGFFHMSVALFFHSKIK